jgi:hypothetical protein
MTMESVARRDAEVTAATIFGVPLWAGEALSANNRFLKKRGKYECLSGLRGKIFKRGVPERKEKTRMNERTKTDKLYV